MKASNINRRDYLKTTTAGVILASTPAGTVTSLAQEATPGAPVAERQRVDGLPNQPVAEGTFFRADLSRCSPAEKLSRTFEEGRWQLTDYETVEGVKGVMVSAYPEHDCGELTLPLDAKGPHKVFLGINFTRHPTRFFKTSSLPTPIRISRFFHSRGSRPARSSTLTTSSSPTTGARPLQNPIVRQRARPGFPHGVHRAWRARLFSIAVGQGSGIES